MPSYSRHDIILVRYPFSDLSNSKIRPAIVVSAPHPSSDVFIVPLTSRLTNLLPGEFVLSTWQAAGLNVPSAVKRGIYTVESSIILKLLGQLTVPDVTHLETALRRWLALPPPV